MKSWQGFLIIGLSIAVVFLLYSYLTRGVCYKLPTDTDPEVFGPKYWAAIHDISNRIPCPSCRADGKPLFVFAHDIVNAKIGKPLWNKENFLKWQKYVSEIKLDGEDKQ